MLCGGTVAGLARPGQAQASDDPRRIAGRQARLGQALSPCLEHGRKALVDAEADICRTGDSLRKRRTAQGRETRTTSRPAAIDAEQQQVGPREDFVFDNHPRH
jgi:hypothetical protein